MNVHVFWDQQIWSTKFSRRNFSRKLLEVTNTERSSTLNKTRRAKPREPLSRFELFGGSQNLKMEKWGRGCLPQGSPRTRASCPQGNSIFHGARPVHQIISMITWIRTSRLSIKNSLSPGLRMPSSDPIKKNGASETQPHAHLF
jgi:hypothetical protein